jgi:hypothetical protein
MLSTAFFQVRPAAQGVGTENWPVHMALNNCGGGWKR